MLLRPRIPGLVVCTCAALGTSAHAQGPSSGSGNQDLAELSLEDLMEVEVSVASRHTEKLADVPAAVYVLTGDELRRQGVTSVQEALRMVPGFHVAQWRTQGWDVASRGFTGGLSALNQSFTNQLLLMVDGVSLYSPVMAGIWWPLVDIPISDIDRIEIIRGPAGTLWGANAMNGVVHVMTKHPRDTQGAELDAHVGSAEQSGDFHYGGKLGDDGWFRVWTSTTWQGGLRHDREGDWNISSVGWRSDWTLDHESSARVLGTLYTGTFGPTYIEEDDADKVGGFLSATYETGSSDDQQRIQGYYWLDHQIIPDVLTNDFHQNAQTFDLEWTRRMTIGDDDSVYFGVGGRLVTAELGSDNGYNDFSPGYQNVWSGRAFAQGEFNVESMSSKFVAGLQVEDTTIDDAHLQPNLRWLWHASDETSVWASIARAVRTPSIEERDIEQRLDPGDTPFFVGTNSFRAETLLAYEIGARTRISEAVSADVTAFYNDYDHLQTYEELDPTTTTYGNEARATAVGFEAAIDADVTERLRVRAAYTFFKMDFETTPESLLASTIDDRDELIPENHANLRTYYDLGDKWEFDTAIYYVDHLGFFDVNSYFRIDARLGWNPTPRTQFSLGVQNAHDPEHPEADAIEVERAVYVGFRTNF